MATADIEGHLSERDCGHTLFSKQFVKDLKAKVVKLDGVVQKFIASKTIPEAERNSLGDKKVSDQKFGHLLTIITDHCNKNDLQPFKTFIDILGDTNNIDMAQQLLLIYNGRVNYHAMRRKLLENEILIAKLKNEISSLQSILEEKERYLQSLTDEKNKLVDHYRKVIEDQKEEFREEKLSLENQIKKREEDLLFVEKEMGELTRTKNVLENEVKVKSNDIRKREEEIVEKERKVREAIEESNRLRLKIDLLQQQHSKATMEDKEELSKKIEILKDEITEKENTIMNLRKNKTMTVEEIEEKLGNITKGQENKLDDLNKMVHALSETVMRMASLLEKK